METISLRIYTPDGTRGNQQKSLHALQASLRQIGVEDLSLTLQRDSNTAQDFGDVLVAICSSSAALVLARGIAAYIQKRGTRVVIETAEGRMIATGDATANLNIERTVLALTTGHKLPAQPDKANSEER